MASVRRVILVSVFLFVLIQCVTSSDESCTKYKSINDPRRSPEYTLARGEKAICDSHLTLGWYRFTNAERAQIPTTRPEKRQCGTVAAIWINGTHPTAKGQEVEAIACTNINNRLKGCMFPRRILVKNCGDYYVYYLQGTEGRCEAYCAGSPKDFQHDQRRNRRSASSSSCSSKNNTCQINGKCFNANATNPNNWCQQCMPGVKKDSWTQRLDNRPPKFAQGLPRTLYAVTGKNLSIQLKATDPDNRTIKYYLTQSTARSAATTLDPSTGLLQFQVTSQRITSFTIQVKDECNAVDNITITVQLFVCPCQNGGNCLPKAGQPRGSVQYICDCPVGFSGTTCDIKICSNQSCFAGVNCTNTPTGISCGPCPAGFAGNGITCQALATTAAPATSGAVTADPTTKPMNISTTAATAVPPIPPATKQTTTVAQTAAPPIQTTTAVPTTAQTSTASTSSSGVPSTGVATSMQTTAAPILTTSGVPSTGAPTTVQTTTAQLTTSGAPLTPVIPVGTTAGTTLAAPTTIQTTAKPIVTTSDRPSTAAAPTTMKKTTAPIISTSGSPSTSAVPTTAQTTQQPTTKATTVMSTTVPASTDQTTTEILTTTKYLTTMQAYETTKEPIETVEPPTITTTGEIPTEFVYVKKAEIELHQEWNDDYNNKSSKAFKDLKYLLEEKILQVYIDAGDYNLQKVIITGFREGSVVAQFELAFKNDSTDPLQSLREATKNGTLGDFKVNPDSIRIQGEIEAKTEPDDGDNVALIVVLVVIAVLILVAVAVTFYLHRRRKRKMTVTKERSGHGTPGEMLPLTERNNK